MKECFRQILGVRSDIIKGEIGLGAIGLILTYSAMIFGGIILIINGYLAVGIPLLVPFVTFPLSVAILYPIFYMIFKIVTVPFKSFRKFLDKISDKIKE